MSPLTIPPSVQLERSDSPYPTNESPTNSFEEIRNRSRNNFITGSDVMLIDTAPHAHLSGPPPPPPAQAYSDSDHMYSLNRRPEVVCHHGADQMAQHQPSSRNRNISMVLDNNIAPQIPPQVSRTCPFMQRSRSSPVNSLPIQYSQWDDHPYHASTGPVQPNNMRNPFLSEGHHYNTPRPFTGMRAAPYAPHEALWRRQHVSQELHRRYMHPGPPCNSRPSFRVTIASNRAENGTASGQVPSDYSQRPAEPPAHSQAPSVQPTQPTRQTPPQSGEPPHTHQHPEQHLVFIRHRPSGNTPDSRIIVQTSFPPQRSTSM